jgi:ApbE superfamily uncharacterized protein (UPF0280 family)
MRVYRHFTHKDAVLRICCDAFDHVTAEIVHQRELLEDYLGRHPEFAAAFAPLDPLPDAPESACRMATAARVVGVGPMAAVAGTMAQLAAEAGLTAGAPETIVENGGDIFAVITSPVKMGLYAGDAELGNRLAFLIPPEATPLAVCSSSGTMGHSTSLGACDLATVVAKDTALADAAATRAANMVSRIDDVDPALETIAAIPGVQGVVIAHGDRVGLAGDLPQLVHA